MRRCRCHLILPWLYTAGLFSRLNIGLDCTGDCWVISSVLMDLQLIYFLKAGCWKQFLCKCTTNVKQFHMYDRLHSLLRYQTPTSGRVLYLFQMAFKPHLRMYFSKCFQMLPSCTFFLLLNNFLKWFEPNNCAIYVSSLISRVQLVHWCISSVQNVRLLRWIAAFFNVLSCQSWYLGWLQIPSAIQMTKT